MSRQLFEEARKVLTQEAAVKLDPVGQEDKDVDNDGDADKTDSYLKKRRGAISAAIAKSKNESTLSDEDVAKLQAILGEMKKKEEDENLSMKNEMAPAIGALAGATGRALASGVGRAVGRAAVGALSNLKKPEDDEKDEEMKNEAMQGEKKPTQGPKPGEVPAYMRKDNARQKFPIDLKDLKKEEVEQTDEAKLNPAGKAAVRDVTKKIGAKTLSQTKAIVALAKLDPKKVKEEVEQTDEAMSPQAKTTMKHIPNPTAGEMKAAKDIKPGIAGYRDRIDMLKSAEARGGLKKEEVEQEDFELIEKLNFEVPDNPSYQDYFKAALKMAQVESFAELDEEDQQYIMSEMENAFRQNDTSFILEADMMGDMNDTVSRLRKAGHKVEDMGRDYKGNPFYVYIDKGSMMRRKVTYKGTQKVTQNMGRAQPEKEEDKQ